MAHGDDPYRVRDAAALQALFGPVGEASIRKEVGFIHPLYRKLIEASPFVLLATAGERGLEVSPRGDPPGFVHVLDDKTLLLPERRGNNRVDSLRNLLVDPRVALLFMIPGIGETLRVNGTASITTAPDLLQRCAHDTVLPKCVIVIDVATVFFQCARAIHRSQLWPMASGPARGAVPSAGAILAALTGGTVGGETYDRELEARQKASLY